MGSFIPDEKGQEYLDYLEHVESLDAEIEPLDYDEYFQALDELKAACKKLEEVGYDTDRYTWETLMRDVCRIEQRLAL